MISIAIVGCGNMGMAYAQAIIDQKMTDAEHLYFVERMHEKHEVLSKKGIVYDHIGPFLEKVEVILLAVKPQDAKDVMQNLKPFLNKDHILVSIMAGQTLAGMEEHTGHSSIVRAMPNLPAQVGKGVTGYFISEGTTEHQKGRAIQLLAATGKIVAVENESMIDAVTAVSGTGPAYFFYFLEAMVLAGTEMGFSEEDAKVLACETMLGSYDLILGSTASLGALRAAVTSKGGTTAAAMASFEAGKVKDEIVKGMLAARDRAEELGRG